MLCRELSCAFNTTLMQGVDFFRGVVTFSFVARAMPHQLSVGAFGCVCSAVAPISANYACSYACCPFAAGLQFSASAQCAQIIALAHMSGVSPISPEPAPSAAGRHSATQRIPAARRIIRRALCGCSTARQERSRRSVVAAGADCSCRGDASRAAECGPRAFCASGGVLPPRAGRRSRVRWGEQPARAEPRTAVRGRMPRSGLRPRRAAVPLEAKIVPPRRTAVARRRSPLSRDAAHLSLRSPRFGVLGICRPDAEEECARTANPRLAQQISGAQ